MLRYSLVFALIFTAFTMAPSSDAQRRAEIIQGTTSGELAATVEDLRVSNAQLRARMTGIESDKAQMTGKLETLEFLLSESRDKINRMQSDDAELQRLVTRLEARLSEQDATIADLNRQIAALRPEPAFLSSDAGSLDAQQTPVDDGRIVSTMAAPTPSAEQSTTGPTRIVRRVEDASDAEVGAAITQTGPSGQPLPQGSLGTLSASALPGDARSLPAG